jgi:fructan beta-fructosidase
MLSFKTLAPTLLLIINLFVLRCDAQNFYHEMYRPQVHFSPKEKWTNDPNGMVFYKGVYHLFFQYYPDSTVWGPMHWGHATSKDLIHWQQQPIALYPDSLGYIFSGSAVVDFNNSSGLGSKGKIPLIAVFTSHDPKGRRQHKNDYENQSLAFSLDEGKTWTKYANNPVLKNPGITDFRDPKVMWYAPQKKWVMTLATKDRVTFFSSKNLLDWKKESEFGNDAGAHGGVWECPDLFPLNDNGKEVWVLVVNLNPGGPNKGSATQYFLGTFNGNAFVANSTNTKWLDYGPDEYAGITWSNTGQRKIFLGWMSNWLYANLVPTKRWRNAMTLPRELHIIHVGKEMYVASVPVKELNKIQVKPVSLQNVKVQNGVDLSRLIKKDITIPFRLNLELNANANFSLTLSNDLGEQLLLGYDKESNQYFIDRTHSGKTDFQKDFAARHAAPRLTENTNMNLSIIVDESSIELFADDGLTVMTSIFFPGKPYDHLGIEDDKNVVFKKLEYITMQDIWPGKIESK